MDRYVKKKQIGEGSFGKALLVQSKQDGKEYVIKEINISKMKKKEREESKKEVEVLKKMKHPNIVSYMGSFEERGSLYIVMDYCDGGDLFKAINSRRGVLLAEDDVMDWFVQICLALKHIHDRKILHRDIKSQNIFLTRKGIVKMGDFGIARVLNNTMELARTCIGTPYYLSPEICENKPYNNKSDIWALGCVLYEMLTLKHAFEAGNMKNLVLKIIRGSYPPVSPRYTYEIRNLQAQLFKRNARDRPSINSVLKKPFIQKRIQKFLTDAQVNDEFSHTVMHGPVRPGGRPGGAPVFQKPASRPPSGAAARKPPAAKPLSNPAAKYGPSVGVKRPPSAGARKPPEKDRIAAERDLEQKKREFIEKEKERRRQKEKQVKNQQQQLMDKQRLAHINKAREAGWKNTLLSTGSSSGSNGGGNGGGGGGGNGAARPGEDGEPPAKELKYEPPSLHQGAKAERGNYDHYHQYLDNLRGRANGAQVGQGGAAMFREEREKRQAEEDALRRQIRDRPVSASGANAARRAHDARQVGAEAAERARMVNEFLQRKREAAANKARAAVQLGWVPPGGQGDHRNEPLYPADGKNNGKNREEMQYLDQLKAIRMQNYQERLNIRDRGNVAKPEAHGDPQISADARRKKIEALKAQADQRAAKLKEQLERQRREAYDKEKRAWEDHLAKKRANEKQAAPSRPVQGPAVPVVPLTAVLRDVGADIAQPHQDQPPVNQSEAQAAEPAPEANQVPAGPRRQWGGETKGSALAKLPLEQTASNMEATSAADVVMRNPPVAHRQWGGETKGSALANLPLEQTASNMEATGAGDVVTRNPPTAPAADRRKWGTPGDTVVNALHMAEIKAGTMTIARPGDRGETRLLSPAAVSAAVSAATGAGQGSPMGVTIIKDRPASPRNKLPVVKGTMVIAEGGKESGDVTECADLETIDAENKVHARKASGEEEPHAAPETRPAWTSTERGSDDSKAKLDGLARPQASPSEKEPGPVSSPKASQEPDATPSSTPPRAEGPPTSKATAPKSPQPGSLPPSAKTSPKSPMEASPSSPSVPKSPGQQDVQGHDGKAEDRGEKPREVPEQVEKVLDAVELEDEEESAEEHQSAKHHMIQGLSTGVFDTAPKLLRTCSDPDLRQLFRTTLALNPFLQAEQRGVAQSIDTALGTSKHLDDDDVDVDVDEDDEEDEELIRQLQELTAKNEEDDEDEEEEDVVEGVMDEEEEYQDLVESMKSVLEARDAAESPEREHQSEAVEGSDGTGTENVNDSKSAPSSPSDSKDGGGHGDDGGEEEEEEDDKENSGETKPINEDWDSGEGSEGEEGGMSAEERESVYSRLEESRLQLEKELGCDTFLQAYKSIQAIHEDEDESIEEGTRRVSQILGEGQGQVYTRILQLVMADGAYTEDNDI